MRQTITYLVDESAELRPSQLQVKDRQLHVNSLPGSKHHSLSFTVDELPENLRHVLSQVQELSIRWVATRPFAAASPFSYRVSAGLHVVLVPRNQSQGTEICHLLKEAFRADIKCDSVQDNFIPVPNSTPEQLQFFYAVPSLNALVEYIRRTICSANDTTCFSASQSLLKAVSFEFDFKRKADSAKLSSFWDLPPNPPGHWNDHIEQHHRTTEVGVLKFERSKKSEEQSLGGFLTFIGRDDHPKPTLFSFVARHHILPESASFSASFLQPTGLHPTLSLRLRPGSFKPPLDSCSLHAHLTLPSAFFVDKYQLSDSLFLQSHNLVALQSISGETDLEAPDWVISKWGSAALLEIAKPPTESSHRAGKAKGRESSADYEVTVPLHLRYLPPAHNSSGLTRLDLPYPAVLWACPNPGSSCENMGGPFDGQGLVYDALFPKCTILYHLPPVTSLPVPKGTSGGISGEMVTELLATLNVPVLDLDRTAWVEWGTVAAILLGTAWVAWKLCIAAGLVGSREGQVQDTTYGNGDRKESKKSK